MAKTAQELVAEANAAISKDVDELFKGDREGNYEDKGSTKDEKGTDDKENKETDDKKTNGDSANKGDDKGDKKGDDSKKGENEGDKKTDDEKDASKSKDTNGDNGDDEVLVGLEAQNKALLEQIENLSGQVFASPTTNVDKTEQEDKKTEDKKGDDKKGDKKLETITFVTEENFEDVLSSSKNLNALLNTVAAQAAQEGERRGYERALLDTPNLVEKLTDKTVSLREAVRDFLDANKDLVPIRKYVGLTVNELRATNPDWPTEKLFVEAGKVVREKLQLSKVAKDVNEDKGTDEQAALTKRGAGGGGGSRGDTKSKLTDLQEEIGDLAAVAGRR